MLSVELAASGIFGEIREFEDILWRPNFLSFSPRGSINRSAAKVLNGYITLFSSKMARYSQALFIYSSYNPFSVFSDHIQPRRDKSAIQGFPGRFKREGGK
jgi:hypothetical protein